VDLVSLLFGFKGRINRAQYWLGCAIAGVVSVVLFFTLAILTMPSGGAPKTGAEMLQAASSVALAFGVPMVLMIWAGSALHTKRLHDRGRSAYWALAPLLPLSMIVVNVISGLTSGVPPEQVAASIGMWFLLLQAINLAMFVDIGCMPGKPNANRHGNPPNGGFSGGAPSEGASIPGTAKPAPPPILGMGSTLTSAESAIERAIAARNRQTKTPAAEPAPVAVMSPPPLSALAVAQPISGLRPAAGGSFGRKTSR
jgi:uncharacterized membrane protein YhaH (DUF805 family)